MRSFTTWLILLAAFQLTAHPALGAGTASIVRETTRTEQVGRRVVNVWWLPTEYWEASARDEGMRVRAYISCVFGCPYEGPVSPERSVELAGKLLAAGAEQISLGDTTGMGNPAQVAEIVGHFEAAGIPLDRLALHMHDTRGTALANVLAGLQSGIRCFDASIAGLGGCPYAPGASGNLASEDLPLVLLVAKPISSRDFSPEPQPVAEYHHPHSKTPLPDPLPVELHSNVGLMCSFPSDAPVAICC